MPINSFTIDYVKYFKDRELILLIDEHYKPIQMYISQKTGIRDQEKDKLL
jgi:hypothetical protein